MKKILLLVVVCCTLLVAQAQRVYFIYVQTDNKTPFYLKTGDKVYSSSASGYLIVPRLADSTYNVVIGKSGSNEARFTIPINGKDKGFLLREGSQRLSLFDLQNMTVIEATPSGIDPVSYEQKTDRFTTLLAQAADDPSLLQVAVFAAADKTKKSSKASQAVAVAPAIAEEEKQATAIVETPPPAKDTQVALAAAPVTTTTVDTVNTVAMAEKDTVQQAATEVATTQVATEEPAQPVGSEPATAETVYKRSQVTRRAESSTSEGFGLVFTDSIDGVVDTIRLIIPNPKTIFQAAGEEVVKEDSRFLQLDKAVDAKKEETEEKEAASKGIKLPFLSKKEKEKEQKTTEKEKAPAQEEATVAKKDAPCKNNASESDFARLRRNMVGKSSELDMIGEAEKYFKTRCFTTLQLKTLSSLLLTSAGRYQFFEAAYPHVSDKENFRSLQNELWDRADIDRFKALLAR